MMTRRLLLWATLPIMLLTQAVLAHAQIVCDAPEVKLGNNFIHVAPTGVDDTANIQCALDLAVERNIPQIRLARGEFFIGALSAQDFVGTLQGGGKDHTRIALLDKANDCGDASAVITFVRGEPRVRWLTLVWDPAVLPCADGWLGTLLLFTGGSGDETSCATDVIYATVDRVVLEGPWTGSADFPAFTSGVAARARDSASPDCRNLLLGTLRVNRSMISRFGTGVGLSMEGGAQVGIFQNVLIENHTGLFVTNSNAVVTVDGNHFASKPAETFSSCHGAGVGIDVTNWRAQPGDVRLGVYSNSFEVSQGGWCSGFGLWLRRAAEAPGVGIVISNNRFVLSGGDVGVTGIQAIGISGAVVNGNAFDLQSTGALGLYLAGENAAVASAWTVVSNTGFGVAENWNDIILGEGSSNALIGPGQGADVVDDGIDNTVLPQ